MFKRLELDIEAWIDNFACYSGLFHRLAGRVHLLRELARPIGKVSVHRHGGARQLHASAA